MSLYHLLKNLLHISKVDEMRLCSKGESWERFITKRTGDTLNETRSTLTWKKKASVRYAIFLALLRFINASCRQKLYFFDDAYMIKI